MVGMHAVPRSVREALTSWNYGTEYPLPEHSATGGDGAFKKTYHIGAAILA